MLYIIMLRYILTRATLLKNVYLQRQVLLGILLELGEEISHRFRTVAQIVVERGIRRKLPQRALAIRHSGGDLIDPVEDVVRPVVELRVGGEFAQRATALIDAVKERVGLRH